MQLFWGNKINDSVLIVQGEDVGHISKSLRKKIGDEVNLIDGSGKVFHCVITKITRNQVDAVVMSEELMEKNWKNSLSLAVSLTKNLDRIEWLVEKIVEIGIDCIYFIQCERSQKVNIRLDRINRIVQSAMKQSNNVYKPLIIQKSFTGLIQDFNANELNGFIAHCGDGDKQLLCREIIKQRDTLFLIGPEGDFSPDEVTIALKNGFLPISLGSSRLRTETAGLYAVSVFRGLTLVQ